MRIDDFMAALIGAALIACVAHGIAATFTGKDCATDESCAQTCPPSDDDCDGGPAPAAAGRAAAELAAGGER